MTSYLTEEQAQKILSSGITKINESNVFCDLNLSEDERIEHAKKILDEWKKHKITPKKG